MRGFTRARGGIAVDRRRRRQTMHGAHACMQVMTVNGVEVHNLLHLVRMIEEFKAGHGEFLVFGLEANWGLVVLDGKEVCLLVKT